MPLLPLTHLTLTHLELRSMLIKIPGAPLQKSYLWGSNDVLYDETTYVIRKPHSTVRTLSDCRGHFCGSLHRRGRHRPEFLEHFLAQCPESGLFAPSPARKERSPPAFWPAPTKNITAFPSGLGTSCYCANLLKISHSALSLGSTVLKHGYTGCSSFLLTRRPRV